MHNMGTVFKHSISESIELYLDMNPHLLSNGIIIL